MTSRRRPTYQYLWSLIVLSALIHLSFNFRWLLLQQEVRRFKSPEEYYFRGEEDALLSLTNDGTIVNLETTTPESLAHFSLCTRQQIRQGRWERVWLDKAPYITKTTHLMCHNKSYYQQRPFPSWEWTVNDDCLFATWKTSDFCHVAHNQTISMIGDSLSWEQYSSLLQLLRQRVHQTDQHRSRDERRNHIQQACGVTIVWRNDPRLEYIISESIQSNFPQVLILNRGAHYVNDTVLWKDIQGILPELVSWQRTCQKIYENTCHLLWRTSVPGHPFCWHDTQPNNDRQAMEDRIRNRSHYNNVSIKYHWYDFQHQNQLILQALEDSELDFQVLDAYDLNILRPDEHRAHQNDCLHNRYPGKIDIYNRILLHY